jgi:1,4-alpha-glucan branching enzyme
MSIKRTFQANKRNYKLTFSLPVSAATNASEVQLLGDFNNWDPTSAPIMKKGKEEYSIQIELASPNTYQFRYLIDGNRWQNDFSADSYVPSPFGGADNSVIILENPSASVVEEVAVSKKTASKSVTKVTEKAKPVSKKEVVQNASSNAGSAIKEQKSKKSDKPSPATKK